MDTQEVSLDLMDPPAVVERAQVAGEELNELVADVRARGLISPIVVRAVEGRFRVVAGYRRYLAAQAAGLLTVPTIVRAMDDAEELSLRYRENAHRVNPNPVEEGALLAAMQEGLGLTTPAIAERIGRSPRYVHARLALVHGPESVRDAVLGGDVSFAVAQELMRCQHAGDQAFLLGHAKSSGANATLVRQWVEDAGRRRAALPAGADREAPVVSASAPPIILGMCEWHRGQVPLDNLLRFGCCAQCYQYLVAIRDKLAADEAAAPGGVDHVEGA